MDLRETPRASFRRHPWETSRVQFFESVLRGLGDVASVLDVGSGDAFVASTLRERLWPQARITCWDQGYAEAPPLAREGFTFTATLPKGPFELALLLDVLEHVEDDRSFLASVIERVVPGGHVLVSVPAWPKLFSAHDTALGHFRRYTPAQARSVVEGVGLEIERSNGLFQGLLPVRAAGVLLERFRPPTPHTELAWSGPEWSARAIESMLAMEARVANAAASRGLDVPGLSWWALCRRPS